MADANPWSDDHIVLEHHHGRGGTLLQAPAIATVSVAVLDRAAAGDWPGVRVNGNELLVDGLNGRWRYRVDPPALLTAAMTERLVLTLIEGEPLVPSPQGAAQGGDAPAAAGGGDEGQGQQRRDVAPASGGAAP